MGGYRADRYGCGDITGGLAGAAVGGGTSRQRRPVTQGTAPVPARAPRSEGHFVETDAVERQARQPDRGGDPASDQDVGQPDQGRQETGGDDGTEDGMHRGVLL